MIQEIAPHRYDNHYEPLSPSPDDRVFLFSPPKMLAREGEGREGNGIFITLEVRPSNEPAVKLYDSLGFQG